MARFKSSIPSAGNVAPMSRSSHSLAVGSSTGAVKNAATRGWSRGRTRTRRRVSSRKGPPEAPDGPPARDQENKRAVKPYGFVVNVTAEEGRLLAEGQIPACVAEELVAGGLWVLECVAEEE